MKTMMRRAAMTLVVALAVACVPARGGQPARAEVARGDPLPKGSALIFRTSTFASLDRALYGAGQYVGGFRNPDAAVLDLDKIMRDNQVNSLLPSIAAQLFRVLFSMPVGEFSPNGGMGLVAYPPSGAQGGLRLAIWLPVANFDEMYKAAKSNDPGPDYANLSLYDAVPGSLRITVPYKFKGRAEHDIRYVAKCSGGVVWATSPEGLKAGLELWGESAPEPLTVAAGFRVAGNGDFAAPGLSTGLAASLNPEKVVERLKSLAGFDVAARLLPYLFDAVAQGKRFDFDCMVRTSGEISLDATLEAREGTALSAFVADPKRRGIEPRFLKALPFDACFYAAGGTGNGVVDYLREPLERMFGGQNNAGMKDSLTSILIMCGLASAYGDGDSALSVNQVGDINMILTTGTPRRSSMLEAELDGKVEYFASRSDGLVNYSVYGDEPEEKLETLASAFSKGGERKAVRPELDALARLMEKDGIACFAVYPADIVKLVLMSRFDMLYRHTGRNGPGEMDIFAAAMIGKMLRAVRQAPMARKGFALAVLARENGLGLHGSGSLEMIGEMNEVYRTLVFSHLPMPLVEGK